MKTFSCWLTFVCSTDHHGDDLILSTPSFQIEASSKREAKRKARAIFPFALAERGTCLPANVTCGHSGHPNSNTSVLEVNVQAEEV